MNREIKIEALCGGRFTGIAKEAHETAFMNKDATVVFDFNGVKCRVDYKTDIDLLYRDYMNAHTMEWKTVGPDCQWKYSSEILFELAKRTKEHEEKLNIERAFYEKKQKEKVEALALKISGVEFECTDQAAYDDWKAKNTDGYGNAVFVFAEQWAKLMQVEMRSGRSVSDCAEPLTTEADTVGLSGFQFGAACSVLAKCWKHGEQLAAWRKNNRY